MALIESEKRPEKKEKPLTKVIIRRLPPTMTKEQFLQQVSPLPDYNYLYHVKGDLSMGENAFSRAYINFVCPDNVYTFKEKFDNYVFVDSKGHEYTAVVEFAPFQKIPKRRGKSKMDPKCNSIEADTYYLDFVANLNKPIEPNEKPEYTLQLGERGDDKKKDITTPLLEFIKTRRAQRLKIREVRREEREKRKKEFDRRREHGKYYDDKRYDEKSPSKPYGKKSHIKSTKTENPNKEDVKAAAEHSEEKPNKPTRDKMTDKQPSGETKSRDKKPEEKKERKEIKPRFPKKEFSDTREFKQRDDYYNREHRAKHYDDFKKEDTSKAYPKKIKKYSERREERRMEAQKKQEQLSKEKELVLTALSEDKATTSNENHLEKASKPAKTSEEAPTITKQHSSDKEEDHQRKNKDNEEKERREGGSSSRRIRNKDRPTIPLYRPGMLSKRTKQTEAEEEGKTEVKKELDKYYNVHL